METKSRSRLLPIVFLGGLVLLSLTRGAVAQGQMISISIPSLHLAPKERVVGFELHIKAGRIAKLPNVPSGWNISIGNDPSWNTDIEGTMIVGAAALDSSFFRDFLTVEKSEPLGVPFDVRGEVIVTEDFVAQRRIRIGINSIAIREVESTKAGRLR
ncbi:MAG: hypothetical protein WCC04_09120 [Terriglobales bacterium]